MVATFNIIFLEFLGNYADNFFCVTLVWKRRKIQFQGTLKDFQMSFNFLDFNYFFQKDNFETFQDYVSQSKKVQHQILQKYILIYCRCQKEQKTKVYILLSRTNQNLLEATSLPSKECRFHDPLDVASNFQKREKKSFP